jgi:hypothetical protein
MNANPLPEVAQTGLGTGIQSMGKTPHSSANPSGVILTNMNIKQKLNLSSGSFITAAYPAWLARLARKPVRSAKQARPVVLRTFHFFRERLAAMRPTKSLFDRIKIGLAIATLTALTGCIGVVGDGGGWWGGGWWGGDGGWWGGGDRGRDVHGFSARGAASRGVAHGGGGHAGGGGGGRR